VNLLLLSISITGNFMAQRTDAYTLHHVKSQLKPALTEQIDKVLASTQGSLSKWNAIQDLLLKHKVAYTLESVRCDEFVVHPANRGGLGINPHECHRIGQSIKRTGADLSLLSKAVAFELPNFEPQLEPVLDFNKNLVALSKGLLGPVSGNERYMTVSCGHTTQFIKALLSRCVTTDGSTLGPEFAGSDLIFQQMIKKGWSWTILPYTVQTKYPKLPFLAQQALNSTNNSSNQISELEAAVSLHEFVSCGMSWDAAKEAVGSSNPPCLGYLDAVVKYTQKFSGGEGGPMLRYLDKFGKTYGPNKKVGGEFFEALVDLKLKGSTTFPFLRTAVLATNLAGDKIVDGIARFITKSDIDKLRANKMQSNVAEVEELLLEAWNLQALAVEAEEEQEVEALMAFGKLSVRCVLWLLGKKKSMGRLDFSWSF
jgi:hypothetical protein